MRLDPTIIRIKEEGDLSSIEQAYDKQVAMSNKMMKLQSISYLRLFFPSKKFVDQWSLIHVGIAALRYTTDHQDLWFN